MIVTYSHSSLEEAEKTLHAILNIISEGTWDWNAVTGRVYRSSGWFKMLEYEINLFDENVHTWENIIHPDDYTRVMNHFEAYLKGEEEVYKIQYRCQKADNSYIWIIDNGKIIEKNADGKVIRMIGAHTNINDIKIAQEKLLIQNELLLTDNKSLELMVNKHTIELEKLNKELQNKVEDAERNASTDYLTNIYNRRMFEEIYTLEVNRAKRYRHPLSIVLIDIDNFKLINDNFGHKIGDEILINLVKILKENLRDSDSLARWGGEEFIIVFPNSTREDTFQKANIIRQNIEKAQFHTLSQLHITCSFGVTSYIENETNDMVFNKVDKALYEAKESGKNRVCIA